jgi:hypothetical protein
MFGRRLAGLLLTALFACSGEGPPFEDLPLRDALTADPETIAAMPDRTRQDLAKRFEEGRLGQHDPEPVTGDDAAPGNLLRAVDEARAARGDDALVVASVGGEAGARAALPLPVRMDREAPDALPPLIGGEDAATADLEDRALRGHAGAVVGELVRASGARRVVRVTAWPVGAAAVGDAVYVNASWLVALSPRARGDAGGPVMVAPSGPVVFRPLSLTGNPYRGYSSLEACTADVTERCGRCLTSGSCDAHPTLQDFADAKSECSFLSQDGSRPAELCALALLSISAVGDCVRSTSPTCALPGVPAESSALPEAAAFVAEATCVQALDACLSGSAVAPQQHGCQDGCSSSSSCSGVSRNNNCNLNGDSGGSGGSVSGSSSGNCKCQTQAPPEAPLGALAWLLSPLGYVLLRARRRS